MLLDKDNGSQGQLTMDKELNKEQCQERANFGFLNFLDFGSSSKRKSYFPFLKFLMVWNSDWRHQLT